VKAIAWRRCPFPVAFAVFASFAIIVPISPTLFRVSLPWWFVLALQLAGLLGFAIWVETRRVAGVDCPWLDVGAARRLVMYGALWIVGLLVFAPLSVAGSDLLIPSIVLVTITAVSALALLRIHITVDHGELETAGAPWPLVVSSRLPLYLLILIALLALGAGALALIDGVFRG